MTSLPTILPPPSLAPATLLPQAGSGCNPVVCKPLARP